MDKNKQSEKFLLKVLLISAGLILNFSLEAMMMAKDPSIFANISKIKPGLSYGDYLNSIIFNLFIRVLNPITISLYTFITIKKYGVNFTYKLFFGAMTLISIVNLLFTFSLTSIFYYFGIILNLFLLVVISRQER
uniref:hypothetical protein n=1 Tax=Anaerococcus mediterraneensis TaxID=1870984 RepID=UPI0009304836|nr:hypothetical protein [Anaerococcus mediterraneensis]